MSTRSRFYAPGNYTLTVERKQKESFDYLILKPRVEVYVAYGTFECVGSGHSVTVTVGDIGNTV